MEPVSQLRLSKLQATGNDFLVLADLDGAWGEALDGATRALLCDRRRGVGADGLIRVLPGRDGAALSMELTNADGGPAEVSGNGLRCLAWVAVRRGLVPGLAFSVATAGGIRAVEFAQVGAPAPLGHARVDMGPAIFDAPAIPVEVPSPFGLEARVDGVVYEGDAAGMGNPHLVLFVDDLAAIPVEQHGPILEHDPRFPRRTNVEFVRVESPGELRMRVWERGVGETLSCGSGACAAAAVAHRRGLVGSRCAVEVTGGRLTVEVGQSIWLGGPVAHVFDVEVDVDAVRAGAESAPVRVVR